LTQSLSDQSKLFPDLAPGYLGLKWLDEFWSSSHKEICAPILKKGIESLLKDNKKDDEVKEIEIKEIKRVFDSVHEKIQQHFQDAIAKDRLREQTIAEQTSIKDYLNYMAIYKKNTEVYQAGKIPDIPQVVAIRLFLLKQYMKFYTPPI